MTLVAREVHGNILVGEFDGLGATVYRVYKFGSTTHGVYREATGIAEHVQNRASFRVSFEQVSVFALVNEEPCLLALEPVDAELQTVLQSDVAVVLADEILVLRFEAGLEGESGVGLVVDVAYTGLGEHGESVGDFAPFHMHAGAVCLHHAVSP